MKILSQRCATLEYAVTTASSAAITLDSVNIGVLQEFSDCLFLLVGVERSDLGVARQAAKVINRIANKTGATRIVINGLSQMADPYEHCDGPTAQRVLAVLAELLSARGWDAHPMPFGWNKEWTVHVLDGEWEQRVTHLSASNNQSEAVTTPTVRHRPGGIMTGLGPQNDHPAGSGPSGPVRPSVQSPDRVVRT
ncbi:threonyl-tRNA synthetase editing domain-containing protein [Nocardia sp. NBC_00881]|uniref:threonyl-tRNA synthetase editing domain-containing protein n=1 Tax=Nocardia sp. NBC_00881 TaxID=2975995 RepID=UPI00386FAD59|nr:threonyl-tRNA synthetase editing domain-containing protein [Nocardia sp. NBC_00881]